MIVFNATFSFSQNSSNIDSLLNIIELRIEQEDNQLAIVLIDSIKMIPEYAFVSEKLKVDFILARLYNTQNEHEKALKILLNGLTIINGDASSKFTADYAYELGSGFSRIKDYSNAFKYFRLVLSNSLERNDSLGISKGYLGLESAHLHQYKGMNRVLIESDSVSLKIHGDSSIYYYDKAILISLNGKLGQKYLADVYANLVVYNFYEENHEIAEKYCFKSLNIYQINKDIIKMMEGV